MMNKNNNEPSKTIVISIKKRDGRLVPFDKDKIIEAIFKAAKSVGGQDRYLAEDLAEAVTMYLNKEFKDRIPSVEEIQDAVEKVLIKTGHAKTAKAYILYREKRQRIRKIKQGIQISEEPDTLLKTKESTDLSLFVRTSGEDIITWNREKIVSSLVRETSLDERIARTIAVEVEKGIFTSKVKFLTSPLIREMVNAKLIELGFEQERKKYTRLGLPLIDVRNIIIHPNKENANIPHNPEATNLTLAENIKKEFALLEVFSPEVSDAHMRGDIHLHDLGFIDRPYSFSPYETIIIKENGFINCFNLKQFFEFADSDVIKGNDFEFKEPQDIKVLDKGGFVSLKRVIRHKISEPLLSISTKNGKTIVVTKDHPFIRLQDKIKCIECKYCGNKENIVKDGGRRENTRIYWCKKCGKRFRGNIQKVDSLIFETVSAEKLTTYDFILTPLITNVACSGLYKDEFINNEEKAWFLGYFIAEGFYGKNEMAIRSKELVRVKNYLDKNNIKYAGDEERIRIYSKSLTDKFQQDLQIGIYSQNKTLPSNFYEMEENIQSAIISGIIDGDGTIRTDNYVTEVMIRVTSKTLLSQIQLWLDIKGIRNHLRHINSYGPRWYRGKKIESRLPLFLLRIYLTREDKKYFKMCNKINKLNGGFKSCKKNISHSEFSPVFKIKEIKNIDSYVYDITTESKTFICSGIWAHNCSGQSLEYIKKFGLNLPNSLSMAKPAKHPETLLAHMVKFSAALQGHFNGAIGWDAINVFFAPFLTGVSDREIKQLAQMLIYEYSQQAVARGGQAIFSDVNLYWEIPEHFVNVKAIGPGGTETGKVYGEYEKESQGFIKALFEVYLQGDGMGRPFFFPKPLLHITNKFFQTEGADEFLELACLVGSEKGNTYFVFDRDNTAKISECCRLQFKLEASDLEDAKHPWKMRFSALQNVTLNLPRCAYIAEHDETKLFETMDKFMERVVKAHIEKRRFIEKILALGQNGPLALLTMNLDGESYLRMHRVTHLIGLLGLNEMVQYHTGLQLHESEDAFKMGLRIISYLKIACEKYSRQTGLKFVLEQTPAESTAYRFARLDLGHYYEQTKEVIKGTLSDNVYYTNSTYLNISENISPVERVRKEGVFHPLIDAGALTHVWLGESNPDVRSLSDFVIRIFRYTKNSQVAFSPEFTSCLDCGKVYRGLHSRCPHCSAEKEGIKILR
ncbi:MAG: anaerobic ribonucleoside-triphosphate reductase [Candidatus Omnitrophica bacterium]|nr:anaerobic ribonucleoside-triphosphate reductase [Candidatus Omnitrophota bacterium]